MSSTTEAPRKCIGVVGYYGGDQRMNAGNYEAMIRECIEIVKKDFQLDLAKCSFVGNGGTWSAHIPIEMWKEVGNPSANNVYFVFPEQFDAGEKRSTFLEMGKSGKAMGKSGQAMNKSHSLMYNRLTIDHSYRGKRSTTGIGDAIKAGAHAVVSGNINEREQLYIEACDYLIYLPLHESDETVMHGSRLYANFRGPKRIVAWADMFER